jgi:phage-related holin
MVAGGRSSSASRPRQTPFRLHLGRLNRPVSDGELWTLARTCVGLAVALITRWLTVIPPMFLTLLLVMALDVISGGLRAKSKRSKRKWDWDKSLDGAKKRGGAVCVILLVGALERHVQVKGLPMGSAMTGVAGFYVWHFGLSMLTNVVALGVPVPKAVRIALGKFSGDPEVEGLNETVEKPAGETT